MTESTNEPEPSFYDELDKAHPEPTGHGCCTVWTLGLLLIIVLIIGLYLLF